MTSVDISVIPFYSKRPNSGAIPLLTKTDIAASFPDGWLTPQVKAALESGHAEFVTTTGTNHDRMQLIRPPFFLLKQYFSIWKAHPDLRSSWEQNCMRLSLTTIRATQHVSKALDPSAQDRTFGGRTLYLNKMADPAQWTQSETKRMLEEMNERAPYHLDSDAFYIAHLIQKLKEFGLWSSFIHPQTVIHAYEYCPANVSQFIKNHFKCPVVNLYGSTELGFFWSHSSTGVSEFYLEGIVFELLPVPEESNGIYNLIVTSYRNPYMPLIRYKTGDCVQTTDQSSDPQKILRICGREKELLKSVTGRVLSHADIDDEIHLLTPNIFLYQLEQPSGESESLILRYTTFDQVALESNKSQLLCDKLQELTGVRPVLSYCQNIEPVASGKYAWLLKQGVSYDG